MTVFVSHGSTEDHVKELMRYHGNQKELGWTVNPNVKVGDTIVFYIKSPRCEFVAIGESLSDSRIGEDDNWRGENWADIRVTEFIDPVHIRVLRDALPDWGWPKMPQARVRVPKTFQERFLELLRNERAN